MCFRNDGCRHNCEMEPQQGRTASPLRTRRQRPYRLRKTTLSLGWAECREKIGIEPTGELFSLDIPSYRTLPVTAFTRASRRISIKGDLKNGVLGSEDSEQPSQHQRQLSSTEKFSVSHMMTDRSITFCNSRMLPGQGYDRSNSKLLLFIPRMFFPAFLA